jgi:hypothetical protein
VDIRGTSPKESPINQGFSLVVNGLEGRCSIHLSYGRIRT